MPEQTTIYVDSKTRDRLNALARLHGRSKVEQLRRLLDNTLDNLPSLDQVVLFQVAKDQGLGSIVEAASHIIRDWQRMRLTALSPGVDNNDGQGQGQGT